MKWTSAVSEHRFLKYAVAECAVEINAALGEQSADLIVVFVSAHHAARYDQLPELVRELVGDGVLIGCSGGGIIGAGKEVEHSPGFAMTAAVLPDVTLNAFHVEDSQLPDGDAPPQHGCVAATSVGSTPTAVLRLALLRMSAAVWPERRGSGSY